MTASLNLHDIQGNVIRAYGRFAFPFARYFFFHFSDADEGRKFVDKVRARVTTGARWPQEARKPDCTVNIGFTFLGLLRLGVPPRTLRGMSDVFIEGMKERAFVLGDRDVTKTAHDTTGWDAHWDPIWRRNRVPGGSDSDNVHAWISLNAQLKAPGTTATPVDALAAHTDWLRELCGESNEGVHLLSGHGRTEDNDFQSAAAVFETFDDIKLPSPKEHFGFADGIGDPVFEGQYPPEKMKTAVIGRGKRVDGEWHPIATGEFILGHPDESQELPPTAAPPEFMHNGTYMAYRKLHENVATFDQVLEEEADLYAKVMSVTVDEARETLRAKMCGRWSDGVPLARVPTHSEWIQFRRDHGLDDPNPVVALENQLAYIRSPEASDFRYADDMAGLKCPGGAHIRRMNTRDYLDPLNKSGDDPETGAPHVNNDATHALNKRRRVLRRGLPYGAPAPADRSDQSEQGVAMMIIGANLFRQFEFVQQQWVQYGLDFHQGNNTCPILGSHDYHQRHTIPSSPDTGKPPYVMSKLKTFVECRGGDYFFIPSMTALRLIAMGVVDPT
ncbi:MAG: peroxidase [Pseudomonadota bacterium]